MIEDVFEFCAVVGEVIHGIQIRYTQQNLSEDIFEFILFEGIIVELGVFEREILGQREFTE